MKVIRNLLAIIGFISLLFFALGVCWWNGILNPFKSADLGPQPVENPERTHVAHHNLIDGDEIIFQGETYDGFFGDGGGTVIAKLAQPLQYSSSAWRPMSEYPSEFREFFPASDDEFIQSMFESPKAIWCVMHLQRSGERISNLVVAYYNPDTQILIEHIIHT